MMLIMPIAEAYYSTSIIGIWNRKKADDLEVPKVDKSNWTNNVLHFKLLKGVRGVPLAYVIRQHIKVVHISSG